jgi:hypothetical protein
MRSVKLLIFAATLVLFSCSKDDNPPVINISTPIDGSTVERGKTYPIAGLVTDDTELVEVKVEGNKVPTLDSKTSHVIKDFNFTVPNDPPSDQATLSVTAKDKEGNEAVKTIVLKVK